MVLPPTDNPLHSRSVLWLGCYGPSSGTCLRSHALFFWQGVSVSPVPVCAHPSSQLALGLCLPSLPQVLVADCLFDQMPAINSRAGASDTQSTVPGLHPPSHCSWLRRVVCVQSGKCATAQTDGVLVLPRRCSGQGRIDFATWRAWPPTALLGPRSR